METVKKKYKVKRCADCSMFKSFKGFSKDSNKKFGLCCYCKECKKKRRKKPTRVWHSRYNDMKRRVNSKNVHHKGARGKDICDKEEFMDWCEQNRDDFMEIYSLWKESDFDRKHSPSINRIDDERGYTLDNIEWTTTSENSKQNNLKRKKTRLITYKGDTDSMRGMAVKHDINPATFRTRLENGWSVEEAVETPVGKSP